MSPAAAFFANDIDYAYRTGSNDRTNNDLVISFDGSGIRKGRQGDFDVST